MSHAIGPYKKHTSKDEKRFYTITLYHTLAEMLDTLLLSTNGWMDISPRLISLVSKFRDIETWIWLIVRLAIVGLLVNWLRSGIQRTIHKIDKSQSITDLGKDTDSSSLANGVHPLY